MTPKYWVTWDPMSSGSPIAWRLFVWERNEEVNGYSFRVLRFYDETEGKCEMLIREDDFRDLVQTGKTRPFVIDGGKCGS